MPRPTDVSRETLEVEVARALAHCAPVLRSVVLGERYIGNVLLEGFSVRIQPTGYLVVFRGVDLEATRPVVAFGFGSTLTDALRNVGIAIGKRQWKADNYRKSLG